VALGAVVDVLVGVVVGVFVGPVVGVFVGPVVGVFVGMVVGVAVAPPDPSSSPLQPPTAAARLRSSHMPIQLKRTLIVVILQILRRFCRPTRSRIVGGTPGSLRFRSRLGASGTSFAARPDASSSTRSAVSQPMSAGPVMKLKVILKVNYRVAADFVNT
jgi:hypothetical protein